MMDNLLPTITVLMAEASVVLLLLLGFLSWRYLRRKRQHEAEIETLIAMAQGREITLPAASTTEPPAVAVADGTQAAPSDTSEENDSVEKQAPGASDESVTEEEPVPAPIPTAAEQHSELTARLAEIRHAQELMDAKLNQLRHDHQKLAANIFRALEKTGKDVASGRHEIDRTYQLLGELRKKIAALPNTPTMTPAPAVATPRTQAAPIAEPRSAPAPQVEIAAEQVATHTGARQARIEASEADELLGLDPEDPDLVLDQDTLDRLAAPAAYRPGNGGIAVEEISLDDLAPQDIREAISGKSSLFSTPTQVFFQSSTQETAQGWYFSVDGGLPHGPFSDKLTAELVMEEVTGAAPPRRELG